MSALKEYRESKRFTLRRIADVTGISLSTVFYHVNNRKRISAESAMTYHRVLGIPLHELRPDLWPPPDTTQHQEAVHEKPATSSC